MRHGIPSKKGYEINYKRYFLASKIGNKSMFKSMILKPSHIIKIYKISNRLKWFIEKMLEKIGYYFVGYKVDINENYKDIKALKKEINTLNDKLNKHMDLGN